MLLRELLKKQTSQVKKENILNIPETFLMLLPTPFLLSQN